MRLSPYVCVVISAVSILFGNSVRIKRKRSRIAGGPFGMIKARLAPDAALTKIKAWFGDDDIPLFEQADMGDAWPSIIVGAWDAMGGSQKWDNAMVGYSNSLAKKNDATRTHIIRKLRDARIAVKAPKCNTLPPEIAIHLWRYREEEVDACLKGLQKGEVCTLHCKNVEQETALTCGDDGVFKGDPPESLCLGARHAVPTETTYGKVTGFVRPIMYGRKLLQTNTFWGIRFGAKTERFKSPQAPAAWEGIQPSHNNFKADPPHCEDASGGVEDCLFLSVDISPKAKASNLRPVFFWIGAGGFFSSDVWSGGKLDASRLALENDIVVVLANFRTSFFGHWAMTELAAEDSKFRSTGNYGMQDQVLAMEWVRDNIKNFHGDPSRVTIGGHSSGAFSTAFHLYSDRSRGLFHSAILEGGTLDNEWYFPKVKDVEPMYTKIGDALGCDIKDATRRIACLRELPSSAFWSFNSGQMAEKTARIMKTGKLGMLTKLARLTLSRVGLSGSNVSFATHDDSDFDITAAPLWPMLFIGPVVDNSAAGLKHYPRAYMQHNAVAPVPLYLSYAKDEGTVFGAMLLAMNPVLQAPGATHAAVDELMSWVFGNPDIAKQVTQVLYRQSGWDAFTRTSEVVGDLIFKCSNLRAAKQVAAARPGSVYLAESTFLSSGVKSFFGALLGGLSGIGTFLMGASHMEASQFTFGDGLDVGGSTALKEKFRMLWQCQHSLFIHCGSPDITSMRECVQASVKKSGGDVQLLNCERFLWQYAEKDSEPYPKFNPFNPSKPTTYALDLTNGKDNKTIIGPVANADLDRKCRYFDSLPSSTFGFRKNICYGCKGGNYLTFYDVEDEEAAPHYIVEDADAS